MKKSNRLLAALALFVLLAAVFVSVIALSAGKRAKYEESFTVQAMQFGDVPISTVVSHQRSYEDALLSSTHGVSSVTHSTELYDIVRNGLLECSGEISLSGMGVSAQELRDVVTEVINTTPALFYVNSAYQIGNRDGYIEYMKPSYKASGEELENMKAEYEALVSEIIGKIRPSWNNFEKVLFVHDYIVKNFEYDYSFSVYDSYGMLKGGKGVCQAYTLLCIELLGRLDIGVGAVPSIDMNHIWNCVSLDGKWYHMDITWSDASAPGNHDRFDDIIYTNFLCSDSAISASGHHGWDSDITFSSDYDQHFIKSANRIRISPLGDAWYVVMSAERESSPAAVLALADLRNGTYEEKLYIKDKWYVFGETDRYYTASFAGLGSYYDSLVISTSGALYAYNLEAGLVKLGDYAYTEGSIYGLVINGSTATLRVASDPGDFSGDIFKTVDLSEIKFTLEITYQNKADPSDPNIYSDVVGWGKEFSVSTPDISGVVTETPLVSGKMSLGGIYVTVFYKRVASLKIDYVYEDGSQAAPSYTDELFEIGEPYNVASPKLGGFRPDISVVSGVMTEDGVNVTVVYTTALYELKIHYVYADGTAAAESIGLSDLEHGYEYDVLSPTIEGHTPDLERVLGTLNDDTEITVVYTPVSCTVKVEYLYPDGSVADMKEITVGWGSEYSVESPTIKGHTPDKESVSGVASENFVEFTVSYTVNKYTLTVKYVYEDGSEAAPAYIEIFDFGTHYLVDSPEIAYYTPSFFDVSGEMSDGDVEITVIYSSSKYTISFWSQGELFYAITLEYGEEITLPSDTPQIEPTADKVYTFAYWEGFTEGLTVTGSEEFFAVFDESPRKYSVAFKNYDGSVLYQAFVEYGKNAVYLGEVPVRPSEEGVTYTFVGWDDDTESITSDKVFNAMFTDGVTQYTVSFYDGQGNLIKSEKVYYGQNATPPEDPGAYADETYEYFFTSWEGKYRRVTSDCKVNANYRKVYIEYEIVFKDHEGKVLSSEKLHFGDAVDPPEAPVRESDEKYDYVFEKWSPEFSQTVNGNIEYTAVFTGIYKYEYTAEEFIAAVEKIESCCTLAERFAALSKAFKMRDSVYVGDEGITEAIALLEEETEKYNEEISGINERFEKINEDTIHFFSDKVSVMKLTVLATEDIKKRKCAGGYDE